MLNVISNSQNELRSHYVTCCRLMPIGLSDFNAYMFYLNAILLYRLCTVCADCKQNNSSNRVRRN